MTVESSPEETDGVPVAAFWPFLLIAFGMAWGIFVLFVLFGDRIARLTGPLSGHHPLFILAVYAPAIAGVALVLWHGGAAGLGRYLTRLTLWRCGPWWWALLILGIPVIYFAGAAAKGDLAWGLSPGAGAGVVLPALALTLIIGPVEEFGWRGVALPLLQRRLAPVWAGLVLGLIWGVWHLPAFLLSGTPQSAWSFTPFLLGSVAISVIVTPLFNAARGSILLPALMHFQLNNPLWPDAQPFDIPIFVAAAAIVVWLNRATMFRRGGVTRVIPA